MKANLDVALLRSLTVRPNTILVHENTATKPTNRITGLLVENFSVRLDEGTQAVLKLPDGRYRVRCKGQHCGVVNRNRRRYPVEVWAKHTAPDSPFMRRVRARRVTGHLEHPDDGKSNMALGAIVITDVTMPDAQTGEVMIEFETMSTPAGKIAASYIADGVGFGISSRGNGSVIVDHDGISVVQDDFDPSTFDLVIDESTPGAEVAAERVREACDRLLGAAAGNPRRAMMLAEAQVRSALKRDVREAAVPGTAAPPTGYNEALLTAPDGSGIYRAYDTGIGQWDVWFMPATLPPEKIGAAIPTLIGAKKIAEEHLAKILPGRTAAVPTGNAPSGGMDQTAPTGVVPSGGAAPVQVVNVNVGESRSWAARLLEAINKESPMPNQEAAPVAEAFVVLDGAPYSGVCVGLGFASKAEAATACEALVDAGFYCDLADDDDELDVYTGFADVDQAIAHLSRVLNIHDIAPKEDESVVAKIVAGKVTESRPFSKGAVVEFYGQTFPVNADDEFELWDEQGQPTKWGATKESRKGKGDDKDKKDEHYSTLIRKTAGQPNGGLDVTYVGENVIEVREYNEAGKLVGYTGPRETYLRLATTTEAEKEDDKKKDKDEAKGKGEKEKEDDKKDERKGKGDDEKKPAEEAKGKGDDADKDKKKDENTFAEEVDLVAALRSHFEEGIAKILEKRKGKGGKTSSASMPEAKGKGDDKEKDKKDKKDERRGMGIRGKLGYGKGGRGMPPANPSANEGLMGVINKLTESKAAKPAAKPPQTPAAAPPTSNTPAAPAPAPVVESAKPAPVAAPKPPVCQEHDAKIRHLQGEVARFERENTELRTLFESITDINVEQEVHLAVYEAIEAHPELLRAKDKLKACESREAVLAESKALLGLLVESTAPAAAAAPPITTATPTPAAKAPSTVPTSAAVAPVSGAGSTTSVQSSKTEGAPTGPLANSTAGVLVGALKESHENGDGLSRVKAYRDRKRQG